MKLKKYLTYKFGNYTGSLDGILYMLKQSFMAATFRGFWQNWNPLWSFYLIFYVYKPINKLLSKNLSILLTFLISGFLHDCVAMLLMHQYSYKMTLFFFLLAIFVLIEKVLNFNIAKVPKLLRPIYHLTLIALCLFPIFAENIY
ncbi:MAG: MBOAT family O-acyltransferase [Marinicellaceae bacterium]